MYRVVILTGTAAAHKQFFDTSVNILSGIECSVGDAKAPLPNQVTDDVPSVEYMVGWQNNTAHLYVWNQMLAIRFFSW
jgi:hypothetical protein